MDPVQSFLNERGRFVSPDIYEHMTIVDSDDYCHRLRSLNFYFGTKNVCSKTFFMNLKIRM